MTSSVSPRRHLHFLRLLRFFFRRLAPVGKEEAGEDVVDAGRERSVVSFRRPVIEDFAGCHADMPRVECGGAGLIARAAEDGGAAAIRFREKFRREGEGVEGEFGERFVEEEDHGIADEGAAETDEGARLRGEGGGGAIRAVEETEALHHAPRAPGAFPLAFAAQQQGEGEVLRDGLPEEEVSLRELQSDALPVEAEDGGRDKLQVDVIDADHAFIRRFGAEEEADERRFSRFLGTGDADALLRFHGKRHIGERHGFSIRLRHPGKRNHGG